MRINARFFFSFLFFLSFFFFPPFLSFFFFFVLFRKRTIRPVLFQAQRGRESLRALREQCFPRATPVTKTTVTPTPVENFLLTVHWVRLRATLGFRFNLWIKRSTLESREFRLSREANRNGNCGTVFVSQREREREREREHPCLSSRYFIFN